MAAVSAVHQQPAMEGRVLSKEVACRTPPPDITPASLSPSQPISQSVHISGSVAGQAERGGARRRRGGRQHRLKKKKKMVTQSNRAYLHFSVCLDVLSCPLTHTHARRGARLQLLAEEGERADLQPEFATK